MDPVPSVIVDGPLTDRDLQGHVFYHLDPGWQLDIDEAVSLRQSHWQIVERIDPDFGYIKDRVWLRIDMQNGTPDEREWRMHIRENFKQYMDVYVRRDSGDIEHILSLDRESTYHDRPIPYPEMIAPFMMEPGEHVTLYISYWSEGSSYVQLALQTTDSFAIGALEEFARNFIYYGMVAILILAAAISWLVLRQGSFLAYVAYASSILLFIMHADGVAFQYFWPNQPGFNSIATIVLGGALTITSAQYARTFLQTSQFHPVLDRLLLAAIGMVVLTMLSGFFVDLQVVKWSMIPIALATMSICALSGIVAGLKRFREVRFYIFAWLGAVASAVIMNMRHVLGLEIVKDVELDGMRIAMVFDAVMMGLALFDRYVLLRRSRQQVLEQSLLAAEQNLEMNERLSQLESQYELTNELVASRDVELQNTVHDLRKPLHALRLSVRKLGDKSRRNEVDRKQVEDTLEYLEGLIAEHLQDTVRTDQSNGVHADAEVRVLKMPEILQTIHEMFLSDAQEKGLDLRYVPTTQSPEIEPLVLTRIVANLVSNAIKYTPSGKVLLGVRRDGGRLRVEVHDTGPGMSEEEFVRAKRRTERLSASESLVEGSGLGLSIAASLAKKNGLTLSLESRRQRGATIVLSFAKNTEKDEDASPSPADTAAIIAEP